MANTIESGRPAAAVFVRQATGLVRELSWVDTFIMVFAILNIPLGLSEVAAFATGTSTFPAANMPLAFIFSAPAMLTIGMVYALFTAAMPRSGGDYVWASRVLHPAIGFGVNFFVTFILLSSAGLNSLLMATWFLPPVFHIIGLDNVAAFCADTTGYGAVTVGTVVTLILLGVFLLGLRRVRQIMFGLFTFIMLGTIFWLILLFASSHSDFVSLFNASQGNGAYAAVLATAAKNGYKILPAAVFFNTFQAVIYAFQSYNGFQSSGYFSGEIKQAPSSVMRAMLTALICGAIGFSLGMLAIYHYYGQDFIGSLATNGLAFPNSNALPFPAVMPALGLFVTTNPIVHMIIALTFLAAIFWIQPPAVLIGTRNLFAWSFDRLLPGRLADVNERLHSPVIATVIVAIVIELFTLITIKTNYFGQLLGLAAFSALVGIIISFAAVIFPFRRPDIFEKAPGFVRARFLGVPAISIWGALSMIVNGVLCYIAFTSPAFGGSSNVLDPTFLKGVFFTALGIIIPALLYFVSRFINRSTRQLDIAQAYKDIPPE
ncbi:MAG TPA: APC family permease [Ktedonobacteraceae bacterium]|jgi:amino acid transporter|nr:APC family permease [Ktedonobacteraceae bacterium]